MSERACAFSLQIVGRLSVKHAIRPFSFSLETDSLVSCGVLVQVLAHDSASYSTVKALRASLVKKGADVILGWGWGSNSDVCKFDLNQS